MFENCIACIAMANVRIPLVELEKKARFRPPNFKDRDLYGRINVYGK
ncbi:MAG: hypothetical protein VX700_06740 [Pseudomonadota bacterium]|nr:hypothetical protein [Pseudomonadota bacterium]